MAHIYIIGNSGSGKSTLARRLSGDGLRLHVDLDEFAWAGIVGTRREVADSTAAIGALIAAQPSVIEGMYADIIEALLKFDDTLIWLDVPVGTCLEHCRARPFEPHKWESPAAQDAFLPQLLAFVGLYPEREGPLGAAAHRMMFEEHAGPKHRLRSPAEVALFKTDP